MAKGATLFCLLEIFLMRRNLNTQLDSGPLVLPNNHEEQWSAADNLNVLLDGMLGAGLVMDDGWPLPHT